MLRGPSISTAAKRFFDENTTSISKRSRTTWGGDLTRLERRYPQKRINEVTSEDLRDFLLLDDDGQPHTLAPNTLLAYRTCLRSFFSWCEYAGIIKHDPSSVLTRTVKVKAKGVRQHTWLSEPEIEALFDACYADPNHVYGLRDAVAIGFGFFCGLRVHEITKVAWGDVNLRAGQLFVFGKGAKPATLPIPPQFVEMLFEWQGVTATAVGGPPARDAVVLVRFRSIGGGDWSQGPREAVPVWGSTVSNAGIRYLLHQRTVQAHIPVLAPHDLRRSYAGILEDRGVQLRDISSVLRHESIATTEKYLADNPKKWQDAVSSAMTGIGVRAG